MRWSSKCLVCDKELVHLKCNLQRHYFYEYDKYQGEEHDAILSELKESADLETIKLANHLFV